MLLLPLFHSLHGRLAAQRFGLIFEFGQALGQVAIGDGQFKQPH